MKSGAAVRVNDAGREHGQIRAFNGMRRTTRRKTVPTVVLRNEDYGRITRILADGTPVTLEFTIVKSRLPGRQDVVQRHRRDSRHATRPTKS